MQIVENMHMHFKNEIRQWLTLTIFQLMYAVIGLQIIIYITDCILYIRLLLTSVQ